MHPDRSSLTAQNNAVLRTHEFMRPCGERICSDAYAAWFLPDRLMEADDRDRSIRQTVEDWENRYPGIGNSILARTRFIDDCLASAIGDGIRQLVILGAGYDTRALRFAAPRGRVTVFELDHPNTQRIKRERIATHAGPDIPHVRFIPIDLSSTTLDHGLHACGFDTRLKTFFIVEGVTYYIPAAAVDRTFCFIRRNAARDSRVVFDYFPPSIADGTTRLAEARALRSDLKQIGEEIVFGIAPERIMGFMERCGLTVVNHLFSTDYHAAYFTGSNRRRTVSEMFIFVQARVDGTVDQYQHHMGRVQ